MCIKSFTESRNAYKDIILNKDYQIIITDQCMPFIEGDELIKRVLQIYRAYTILITALSHCTILEKNPVYDYEIIKPLDFTELKMVIDEILEKIKNDKKEDVENKVEKIIYDIKECTPKQKVFLKDVMSLLMYDEDSEGGLYDILSQEMDKHTSTIRQYLNNVIKKMRKETLKNKFGFDKRPKNSEFIRKFQGIIERSEDKNENNDYEKKAE